VNIDRDLGLSVEYRYTETAIKNALVGLASH
jgi:hypothetical protein